MVYLFRVSEKGSLRSAAMEEERRRVGRVNLANGLTAARLLLIPTVGFSVAGSFIYHDQLSAALYVVAAMTDALDGQIARRRHLTTELGKFLDPLADKLLVITVLAVLVSQAVLAVWVLLVVVAREFLITGLRFVAASQGVVVGSTPWGKSKTLTQNLMICALILQRPYWGLHSVATVLVYVAVIATVCSGLDYLWRYRHFVI